MPTTRVFAVIVDAPAPVPELIVKVEQTRPDQTKPTQPRPTQARADGLIKLLAIMEPYKQM